MYIIEMIYGQIMLSIQQLLFYPVDIVLFQC